MEARELEAVSLDGGFSSLGRVSLLPEGCEESSENPPAQALAVSNRFGLTFFATSKGFSALRTADLVQVSRTSDEGNPSICEKCIITVDLPKIRMLKLSQDNAALAVCTVEEIRFFYVWNLVQKKDKEPFKVQSLGTPLKDFQWSPTEASRYFTLSGQGTLSVSDLSDTSIENVSAACWSPDGKNIAYAVELVLNIVSADLVKIRSLDLPSQLPEMEDASATASVDLIRWTSARTMLVSYVPKDDSEDMGCALFFLRGTLESFSEGTTAHSVPGGFASISSTIISDEYGPYTLTQFLEPWKLAIVSYRKAVDDHVILLGCDENESVLYDLHDSFRAYIPVVGDYGDENTVTGLAIDTTSSMTLPDPRDKSVTLPPCPIVLCSTRDSRVCVFRLIRYENDAQVVSSVCSIDEIKPQSVQNKVKDVGQSITSGPPLSTNITAVSSASKSATASMPALTSTAFSSQGDNQNCAQKGVFANSNATPMKTAFSFSKTVNEQVRKAQEEILAGPRVESASYPVGRLESSKPNGVASSIVPKSGLLSKQLSMPPVPNLSEKQPGIFAAADKQLNRAATVDSVLKVDASRPAVTPPSSGDLVPQPRRPGMSDMEADFVLQLEKVKRMYDDLDQFMSLIEGKGNSQESSFTRSAVEKLERDISGISEKCNSLKQDLREHSQLVEELRDQGLQVDAWRIYVESLVEQAGDSRYQDLWFRQKLHPEMDIKRKHVVNADQALKRQIAELESHLHVLELNERQGTQRKPQVPCNRQFQSLQSLYNTVNSQFEAAEQLASRLADLMDQLNLPLNAASRKTGQRTDRRKVQPAASSLQQVLSTPPKSVSFESPAPDSTMRRRDSMDNAWADLEATKTTIRRATRIKSRAEPSQSFAAPTNLSSISGLANAVLPQARRASFSTSQQPAQVLAKATAQVSAKTTQVPVKATSSMTSSTLAPSLFPAKTSATAQVPAKSGPFSNLSVPEEANAAISDTFAAPSTDLTKQLIFATPLTAPPTDDAPTFSLPKVTSGTAAFGPSSSLPDLNESEYTGSETGATSTLPLAAPQGSNLGTGTSSLTGVAAESTAKDAASSSAPVVPETKQAASIFGTSTSSSSGSQLSGVGATSSVETSTSSRSLMQAPTNLSSSAAKTNILGAAQKNPFGTIVRSPSSATQALSNSFSVTTIASSGGQDVASRPFGTSSSDSQVVSSSPFSTSSSASQAVTSSPFGTGSSVSPSSPFGTTSSAATSSPFGTTSSASQVLTSSPFGTTSSIMTSRPFGISSSASQAVTSSPFGTTSSASQVVTSSPFGTTSSSQVGTGSLFGTTSSSSGLSAQPVKTNIFGNFQQTSTSPLGTAGAEDNMEEEPSVNVSGLGGLGLGSLTSSKPDANPFGISATPEKSSPPLTAPTGQLFRPPAFSLPTAQQTPTSSAFSSPFSSSSSSAFSSPFGGSNSSAFSNPFGSSSSSPAFSVPLGTSTSPSVGSFGQPSQVGAGQQALGSALGAFGQARQMGFGASGVGFASSPFGAFSSAPTGGGFGAFSQKAAAAGGFGGFAAAASSSTGTSTGNTPLFTEMRK